MSGCADASPRCAPPAVRRFTSKPPRPSDCELAPGWLDAARAFLDARPDVVCVCGRLRERHPERSIYNLLASMTRFAQWWRRAMRGGHAAAEGLVLHAAYPQARYRRRLARIAFWSAGLLLAAFDLRFGLLVLAYPLQVIRQVLRRGASAGSDWLSARFGVLANFPEAAGALRYWGNRWRRRPARAIEYR